MYFGAPEKLQYASKKHLELALPIFLAAVRMLAGIMRMARDHFGCLIVRRL